MRTAYRLAAVGLAACVGSAAADPGRDAAAADRGPAAAVTLDWSGPATVRRGQPVPYTLTVRNVGGRPAQRVTVQVRPPTGATVTATNPAARVEGDIYLWDAGTLGPGEARPLAVTLAGGPPGEQTCQAWVTLTGTAGMAVRVQEPRLEARIETPLRAVVGEPFRVTYRVTNVGDCRVGRVSTARSCPGMSEVVRSAVRAGGTHFIIRDHPALPPHTPSAADLDPGQSTEFSRDCVFHEPGDYQITAFARGEGGVEATAGRFVQVVAPRLEVTVAGPAALRVGRTGRYTLTVRNAGELTVADVTATVPVPAGLRAAATDGQPSWSLGALRPGEVREVSFGAVATAAGRQTVSATATGGRGTTATAECHTTVTGVPALRCEVFDTADPVEAGRETTYEVRLTNTGTAADADVRVVCELPAGLAFVAASGPTGHARTIGIREGGTAGVSTPDRVLFEPVRELAPKTEAVFRVKVKAAAAGDVRFRAVVTSSHLTAPVVKEESTRVVGD